MTEFHLGAVIGSLFTIAFLFTVGMAVIAMSSKARNFPNAVRIPKREP